MKNQFTQFSGLVGAGVAAACCAGKVAIITAVGAVGLGALVEHAYLYPIFVGFVALALWMLYLSARAHDYFAPFWLSAAGGLFGSIALWLSVTGTVVFPGSWHLFVAAALFLGGSVWDFIYGRAHPVCASPLRVRSVSSRLSKVRRWPSGNARAAIRRLRKCDCGCALVNQLASSRSISGISSPVNSSTSCQSSPSRT